jgi:C4-dicarboxylate-specific signal transduction histidine kinase
MRCKRWIGSVTVASVAFCVVAGCPEVQAASARNVLVLYSNGRLLPANIEVDRGLAEVFAAHPDLRVDHSAEFLETAKFSGEAYERTLVAYLREKYATHPPDVIIAGAEDALDFALRNRQQLFPHAPIVHIAVPSAHLRKIPLLPPDVTGTPLDYDFVGTVEQALRMRPGARHLVGVTGTSAWDRGWEALLRSQSSILSGRLTVELLAGLPIDELQRRLRQLPESAIVFTPGIYRDGTGRLFTPREAARLIAAASAAPVYGPFSTFIGTGIVGGVMASYSAVGRVGGETAMQLLAGTAPASLKVPAAMPTALQVDWRQVRRWGIAPEAVPIDAIVQFREPTFWEAYRQWVIVAGAVMLLQAGLIAGLLFERRQRRRTATALAESEQHMSLAARAANLAIWTLEAGTGPVRVADPASKTADPGPDVLADFRQTLARIHPQDRDLVERSIHEALTSEAELDVEFRITSPDGQLRWQAARGRIDREHGGRLLGVAIDITSRKRSEIQAEEDHARLRHLTRVALLGQLSASIAHQLNQPLTAILGNAEAAQTMLGREPVDLPELREICNDIVAEDLRAAAVIRRLGALFKQGEPSFATLDVNELVRDTLDLMRSSLLTRHVALVTRFAPDLPPVAGDRVQLQQLLINLIVNAADAMGDIAEPERVLTVGTVGHGDTVDLWVADRGPGFPPDAIERMFEPFWSTKVDGMGIGLAVCRSIAVAHRGTLVATNAPAGGAEFRVVLPASATP